MQKISAAENVNNTELNIYTGLFDFSDNKQKAGLFGLQHQDEELFRKSFLGKLSPVTGGFLTEKITVRRLYAIIRVLPFQYGLLR